MVWAKIDDAILDNHKIAQVGALGFAWHVAGIVYCARNLTDGRVPRGIGERLLALGPSTPGSFDREGLPVVLNVGHGPDVGLGGHCEELTAWDIIGWLVEAGLWEEAEDGSGWTVHDFLDFNPSRADAEALSRRRAAAGAIGGARKAARKPRSRPLANGKQPPSNGVAKLYPVPEPVPELKQTESGEQTPDSCGANAPRPAAQPTTGATADQPQDRNGWADKVRQVWDAYRRFHPRASPNLYPGSKEYRQTVARLKDGSSVENLVQAVDGLHRSAWHNGANAERRKWLHFGLVVRDAEHVQKFREVAAGETVGEGAVRGESGLMRCGTEEEFDVLSWELGQVHEDHEDFAAFREWQRDPKGLSAREACLAWRAGRERERGARA